MFNLFISHYYGGWFVPFRLFVISRRHNEGAITKRRKDESEKTLNRRKRKDEMFSLFRYFDLTLFRYVDLTLFRYVEITLFRKHATRYLASFRFRLFVFSFSSFRLFVMAPSLCRREITKRRNGTNQPPYIIDTYHILYSKEYRYEDYRRILRAQLVDCWDDDIKIACSSPLYATFFLPTLLTCWHTS